MRIARARQMGAAEIRWRLAAATQHAYDRVHAAVSAPRWNRGTLASILARTERWRELRATANAGRWDEAHDAIVKHLVLDSQGFVISATLRGSLSERVRRECPGSAAAARLGAEHILSGRHDLLGYTSLDFQSGSHAIDWHYDPVNGRHAPLRFWTGVPFLDPDSADHKVVWEMNRHQHWLRLGRAYWLTADRRYRDAALRQLASWLAANPPLIGINWASMLELAFRSLSWIWTMHFFAEAPDTDTTHGPWMVDLLIALDRQLVHIERNLSHYFSPNTHLLGEALALYVAGRTLPFLHASARRANAGRRILLDELSRQVAPDGGHREQSTHYHRYALDFYLLALAVARITADPSEGEFAVAVERLGEAARLLADDNGRLPHIGDDDGGMMLPIADRAPDDVRDSLTIAGALVDRPDFRIGDTPEEAFWLLGHPVLLPWLERARAAPSAAGPGAVRSGALRDMGYYVSRSAGHHLVLDGGRHGVGSGGHAHADALSMTLVVGGVPLLIDPGTGGYTSNPTLRDRLRSSALHNTLTLDGRSQSLPSGPFGWSHTAASTVHRWSTGADFDYFEASHDGYAPLSHRRHVLAMHGDLVMVADLVSGAGTHASQAYWHIDPRWRVDVSGRRATITRPGAQVDMTIARGALEVFSAATGTAWLGWHAPVYGRVEPASTLRIDLSGPAPTWMLSVFGLNTANAVLAVDAIPLTRPADAFEHAVAVRVSRAHSTDLFVVAKPFPLAPAGAGASESPRQRAQTWRIPGLESDAEVLFARTTPAPTGPPLGGAPHGPILETRVLLPADARWCETAFDKAGVA